MPTYQYACTDCAHQLEVHQSFSDDTLTVCPACEGRLRKVFNAVGVVFKGSGFYRTDSRASAKDNGDSAPAKATEAKPASTSSSDAPASKKPAPTPAASRSPAA